MAAAGLPASSRALLEGRGGSVEVVALHRLLRFLERGSAIMAPPGRPASLPPGPPPGCPSAARRWARLAVGRLTVGIAPQ